MYIDVPEEFRALDAAFVNNNADQMGGAIYIRTEGSQYDHGILALERCSLVSNGAGSGGGLYEDSESDGLSIICSVFRDNYAGERMKLP